MQRSNHRIFAKKYPDWRRTEMVVVSLTVANAMNSDKAVNVVDSVKITLCQRRVDSLSVLQSSDFDEIATPLYLSCAGSSQMQ
jgi:hypothetical protein